MGHSKASKANTHARLVETAAVRFKERGLDGISLADLMKDLALTHGGFYKHFASRDELVAEALKLALDRSAAAMRDRLASGGKPDMTAFVDFYLGEAHRDDMAEGCAVAALAGDATRKSAHIQAQFREHIERNIDALSEVLHPERPAADSRATAILILSALYGALIMARAVGDSAVSREVLRTVRKQLRELGGVKARAGTKEKPQASRRGLSRRAGH